MGGVRGGVLGGVELVEPGARVNFSPESRGDCGGNGLLGGVPVPPENVLLIKLPINMTRK